MMPPTQSPAAIGTRGLLFGNSVLCFENTDATAPPTRRIVCFVTRRRIITMIARIIMIVMPYSAVPSRHMQLPLTAPITAAAEVLHDEAADARDAVRVLVPVLGVMFALTAILVLAGFTPRLREYR